MSLAIMFVKIALISVISRNLTRLPIILSDSKNDKKGYPFPSCRHKSQLIKKGYPFSSFANKCNRSLMLALSEFAEEV